MHQLNACHLGIPCLLVTAAYFCTSHWAYDGSFLTILPLIRASHLVIETSQEVDDVPYADYFRVEVLPRSVPYHSTCHILNFNISTVMVLLQSSNFVRERDLGLFRLY